MTDTTLRFMGWLARLLSGLALVAGHLPVLAAPIALASAPDPLVPVQPYLLIAAGRAYAAEYEASAWNGRLRAWRLDPQASSLLGQAMWDSAENLDDPGFSPDRRNVITHDGNAGIAFRWNSLATAQREALGRPEDEPAGRQRLDFLRGEHGAEVEQGGTLRDRRKGMSAALFRQGDIVHSRPWYTGKPVNRALPAGLGDRPDMVYVGGNDGMLHGFDALTGTERMAYVPRGMFAQLATWAQPAATHRYLVDGHAFSGEADIHTRGSGSAWATVLIGSPGAGAPGFFVLDVSRPAAMTEAMADQLVLVDRTDGSDEDIGHITADPATDATGGRSTQIVQLNDGRWAVLIGNGVNSRNETPVLLLQYLDQTRELRKIAPPCPAAACAHRGGNGLSTPLAIDTDGDGKVDVAYAGDLLGNVWKFDLSSGISSQWKVAFDGLPLFTARDASGNRQPITSSLTWLPHPSGGVMLGLGTGQDLTVADRRDRKTQALYGLHDHGQVIDPATLVAQAVLAGTRSSGGLEYARSTSNPVTYRTQPAPGGWFLTLPAPGEKVLHAPRPFAGQKVVFFSRAAGQEYLTVLNLMTGQPSVRPVFSALVDPAGETQAFANASRVSLPQAVVGLFSIPRQWIVANPGGQILVLDKGIGPGIRAGWRQLQ